MAQGKVKWFNSQKGYGFIEQDEGGPDLFVHFKAIKDEGFKNLNENDVVEYTVSSGPKGETATDVKVISRSPDAKERPQRPSSQYGAQDRQDNKGKPFNRSIEEQLKALRKSSKENQQDIEKRLKRR